MRLERSKLLPAKLCGILAEQGGYRRPHRGGTESAERISVEKTLSGEVLWGRKAYGTSKPGSERHQRRTAGTQPHPDGNADRLHPFVHAALVHHRLPARSPLRALHGGGRGGKHDADLEAW